ncbi:MAG: tautomerase family protein [Ilumatobacter fluminis]|uniref:Phenylpyruvate tautomerase PptA (4-oxalocrotonate tautomerase family) n=1 Tax=Ilumatobacter fluminis TaxID=467091 RepID=A0A4R7HWN9_9ACTN|nr:tautomerase family protein [Ilumatobacter fluminis]TDT14964.1 phenylpyruvate tautomerase PptA (4-oxalocrotonate tautomerase family) [Ilumatobacter fluminis]
MPLYRTLTRPGLLSLEQRQAFANDVVDIHCGITGAPRSFVHVLFADDDDGRLDEGQSALVFGTIRHGRTDAQKQQLTDRLAAALADRASIATSSVTAVSVDVDASYTMEGGVLLPEPGSADEEAWKAIGSSAE